MVVDVAGILLVIVANDPPGGEGGCNAQTTAVLLICSPHFIALSKDALCICAKKVASRTGDIREALGACRSAIESRDALAPQVVAADIAGVIDTRFTDGLQRISALPTSQALMLLFAICSEQPLRTDSFLKSFAEACTLPTHDNRRVFEMLKDAGFLRYQSKRMKSVMCMVTREEFELARRSNLTSLAGLLRS